jgi:hypothetical protein
VIDLLADQPEEALLAMREAVQKELARLTVEAQQIEQALARQQRKHRGGGHRLSREQVLEIVGESSDPMSPTDVHERLQQLGIDASLNSVRNHLARLEKSGWLIRVDDGRFTLSPSRLLERTFGESSGGDDDIPF